MTPLFFHFHPPLHAAIYPAERVVSARVPGTTALPALCTNTATTPISTPSFLLFRAITRKAWKKVLFSERIVHEKRYCIRSCVIIIRINGNASAVDC
ncbi:hypothetical protein, partial [Methanocalculus chunghsingensis]|uniref:hypothetical protein n=1 Tax=Methanocalculus chunghsingensis TaxID=156457 RepID=UPI001B8C4125